MEMDEAAHPMKCARTSNSSDNTLQSLNLKDNTFWYDDGTIILIGGNVEFRVYRGPLAKYSPVFLDMLSFPQPPTVNSSNQSSDCPVVRLTDSPEDLRHVLRVFMAGESLEPLGESRPSFDALSAWIRMGHKYQIDKLVDDGVAYLRRFYPGTLDQPNLQGSWGTHRCVVTKDRPAAVSGKHAIGVVNLARLTESDDLLPLALLECCKLGAEITQGLERDDGTTEYLCPEDLGRCFAAKDQLMARNIEACLKIFASARVDYPSSGYGYDTCYDPVECEENLQGHRRILTDHQIRDLSVDSILAENKEYIYRPQDICHNCISCVDRLIGQERKKLWCALPRLFHVDVDGWGL